MLSFVPRIAIVLLLVVAGVLRPAIAEDHPFYASGAGRVGSGDTISGTFEATHLGRGHLWLSHNDLLWENGIFEPNSGTFVSANGDRLNFEFPTDFYVFVPADGIFDVTLTFTGGTGRFEDATGSADVVFDFNTEYEWVNEHFDLLIVGSIDY